MLKIKTIDKHELDNNDFFNFNEPILVKNGCKEMKAIKKWNLKYLKKKFNNVVLPIEKYKSKKNMNILEKDEIKMKFNSYIEKINGKKLYYCAEVPLEEHQHKIDSVIFDDLDIDLDFIRNPDNHLIFLGNNKNSGCHIHIDDDFMLNQIFGKKIVYMFDYNDNPQLKLNDLFHEKKNFIKNDFFSLNKEKIKLYKVELEPGDSLLIPPWWFHATQGIGLSCSITKTYPRTDKNFFIKYPYLCLVSWYELILDYIDYYHNFILLFLHGIILILFYFFIKYLCNINSFNENKIVLYSQ